MADHAAAPEPAWQRMPLHVPRENGATLAEPHLDRAAADALANAALFEAAEAEVSGTPLPEWRHNARAEVLEAATDYTRNVLGLPAEDTAPERPLIATGHQPAMFHPGVWIKNLGTRTIADAVGGTALNVVVDGDLHTGSAIRIPAGTRESPRFETLAFDESHPAGPWEDVPLGDPERFRTFGERVNDALSPWGFEPVSRDVWQASSERWVAGSGPKGRPGSLPRSGDPPRLRDALTAIRAATERRWNRGTLEVPMSHVCGTPAFAAFLLHLLVQAERFRELHNELLAQFRRINRIRSRTHPVPELERDGDRCETPFWIWRAGEGRRGRLFVRDAGDVFELGNETERLATVPHPQRDVEAAIRGVVELAEQGLRVRTRALTTTLFLRLGVADQFVHGIGGAKYDELTDRLVARFFGVPAPKFALLTGTLHLPLGGRDDPADGHEEVRRLQRALRDLGCNPERHVDEEDASPELAGLLAEKRELIAEQHRADQRSRATRSVRRTWRTENRKRFERLQAVNEELAAFVEPQRRELERRLAQAMDRVQAETVLCSREWAWCLSPEERLRSFLTRPDCRNPTARPRSANRLRRRRCRE